MAQRQAADGSAGPVRVRPAAGRGRHRKGVPDVGFVSATDGTQIFYQDWGSGDPVVFTHSWLLDSNAWEYQFHALVGAGLCCIGLDRRGHV